MVRGPRPPGFLASFTRSLKRCAHKRQDNATKFKEKAGISNAQPREAEGHLSEGAAKGPGYYLGLPFMRLREGAVW